MEDLKAQIEKLTNDLNESNKRFDSVSYAVKEQGSFQLREPLDPFTKRIISDNFSSDFASSTVTLYNKRIIKRVGTTASSATVTIDSDSYDAYTITAQAAALTVAAPTGTPTQAQPLLIRIKDNGTARGITWNSIFRVVGVTLPTTTVISKYIYILCIYNTTDTKWDVVGVNQES